MGKENREHKDSVFVDLFYEDETAKENLLSLYNALHGTDFQDESLIRKVRVEDVLYKNFKNDISFEIGDQVIIFGEHQSTVNPNMPLRCLLYAGRAYEQLVDEKARYRSTLVKIQTPEFYTFYNGKQDYPLEQMLRLSDAFRIPAGSNSVELTVRVININSDKAHGLLKKCQVLKEYSLFVQEVRKYAGDGDALKKAIHVCIDRGILKDYLKRKGSEVRNMLIAEYSYEKDIQVKQEEAMQIGWKQGMEKGIEKGIETGRQENKRMVALAMLADKQLSLEKIAEYTGLSMEEVQHLKDGKTA